jgi:sulfotransferase family protein
MPNNFRHIGLIDLMLPNAKIIDVRRQPPACCLSNLKRLFASGQGFTYGTENIARYYRSALSRSAGRFLERGSANGATTSPGSAR